MVEATLDYIRRRHNGWYGTDCGFCVVGAAFQVVVCSMEGTEHRRTYYGIRLQLYHGTAIPWPGIPGTKTEASSLVVSQTTHALPRLLCRARLRYSSYSRLLE